MSDKVYFNLKDLFNNTSVDTGDKYHIDLNSIEVDGIEQLTADYFAETIRYSDHTFVDAINPHTGNVFEFSKCTQTGVYPDPTSIDVCNLAGAPNSYNPFAHFLNVNYSMVVDGVKRGKIQDSVSGNLYGCESFGFGFDKIDVPINDAAGGSNGSSGASIDGAFWLNIDYTKHLSINIYITRWSDGGVMISQFQHTISHNPTNCTFEYKVRDTGSPRSSFHNEMAHLTGGLSGWIVPRCTQVVDPCEPSSGKFGTRFDPLHNLEITNGGNGALYSFPNGYSDIGQQFMKIVTATNTIQYFGGYYNCVKQVLANNGCLYAWNRTGTGEKIIKLDPLTDTVTAIDIGTNIDFDIYSGSVAFGDYIYFCPTDTSVRPILKFNTVTEGYSFVSVPLSGGYKYREGFLADNDRIYFFPWDSSAGNKDVMVIEPLNSDNVYKIGSFDSFIQNCVIEADNGTLYGIPSRGSNIIKIVPNPSGETLTILDKSAEMGSLPIFAYFDMVKADDSNGYSAPFYGNDILKFDTVTEDISFIPTDEPTSRYSHGALSDNGFAYFLRNPGNGAPILSNEYIYFFNQAPDCSEPPIGEPFCDAIVTQSIGLLASSRDEPVSLFVDAKECCYHSPVFGDLGDSVSYKNDINSFLYKRDFSSETIDFVLLKDGGVANGGSDIPLLNNDYGTYYNFGSLDGYPDYKGYQIEWRKVLNLQGEGNYQMQVTSNLVTGTFVDESIPFKLKAYDPDLVHGTVRIQSVMNGYLRNRDFNYKGLNWLDGIRFEGMFGNRQAEYEEERIIYTNRQARQLRSELINKYNLKSMHLPSCITDIVLEYHNLSNKMLITDYNSVNHKVYIEKEVILDSVNSIEYPVVSNTAPLDIVYKDYVQDYNKSNC